eukprot:jgi/Hompol1/1400/HPOL_003053-RA
MVCGFQKDETTFRLFERNGGDYYSVHGDDALFVAEHLYKTSTVIKQLGGTLPSCTLSKINATTFMKDLLTNRLWRVEIWAQDSRKGTTSSSSGSWRLSKQASPGNLQSVEEMLFVQGDVAISPIVLAATVSTKGTEKIVGIGYTDATTMRKFGVAEFIDTD